jgi:O-antigen polysaccharide polymerase Wzy
MNPNHQVKPLTRKQIAQQRYLKNLLNGLICLLIVGSIYLIDRRPEIVSLEKAFLAVGVIWVSLYPSLQYLADRNRPPMPFMPLIGVFYATSFGFPIFAGDVKFMTYFSLQSVDATALFLVLLGLIGLNAGFYYSKSSLWNRVTPLQLSNTYSLRSLLIVLWILLILHFAFLYIPALKNVASVGQFLDPVGYLSFGMFFVLWQRNILSIIQQIIIVIFCLPLELVPKLASGSLSQVMLLGLFMIVISFFETKRLPFGFILATMCVLLVLNPIKGEFRQLTWITTGQLNPIEKVQLFISLAEKKYTNPVGSNDKKSAEDISDSSIGRTAHIMLFSEVVKDTPQRVPYWQGESYIPLFTSFIPRFLFPGKPEEKTGNDFGRRYSYLGSNDFTTSLNLPLIVEIYANFGTMGMIIGMPLIGMLLSLLEQKLNNPDMQPLEFVTGATILFRLIYQESNLSLMVGGVVSLSIALIIIFKFFLGGRSPRLQ